MAEESYYHAKGDYAYGIMNCYNKNYSALTISHGTQMGS